jgi:hypothetical protein
MFDGKAYGDGIVELVKGYVEREVAPLKAENVELKGRIAELESLSIPDSAFILQLVHEEISKLPVPENGKDADLVQVAALVAEEVGRAVAGIPVPQDGKSVSIEDVAPLVFEEVAKIAPDMRAINEMLVSEVAKAVSAIPVPKDGKDAAGIVEALKDNGELVLTLQDGRLIRTGIRDGENGQPGRDGFNLDDFDVDPLGDGRTIVLSFTKNDVREEYEVKFPVPIYQGVFKEGEAYGPGDMVTWGGSLWHCDDHTKDKPDAGPWRLCVKKGRDGKDAK